MRNKQGSPTIFELPYSANCSELFEPFAQSDWSVLLDSCYAQYPNTRYDIISSAPYQTLTYTNGEATLQRGEKVLVSTQPIGKLLNQLLEEHKEKPALTPFFHGLIGYFSYDLGWSVESLPKKNKTRYNIPEMALGFYDWAFVTDHDLKVTQLICCGEHPEDQKDTVLSLLSDKQSKQSSFSLACRFQSNMTFSEYTERFDAVKQYLASGDCYQVNLSQCFSAAYHGSEWQAYKALKTANPAPYSAYLKYPFATITSHSPEQFLNTVQGHVTTSPIKGTRPVVPDPQRNKALQQALLNSTKDRAENLMIVDLLRNDLSKNCRPGTVNTESLFKLETFANVHHLTSTITGKLNYDASICDLLLSSFPGGSITGAPKIRAMEIIEALEPHQRHIYTGTIGYLGFDGQMNTNIAIRTLLYHNNIVYCCAGGGIVQDSVCEDEYQETFNKVNRLLKCLEAM